jgi:hypothetical protein
MSPEDLEQISVISLQKTLTDKEKNLIDLFMQYPLLPKNQLASMAGFSSSSKKALCAIFSQVMVKLDSARHHKELFREIGFGEVQIILRMKELAMQNSNLTVASNMTVQASRCMDMQKGELDPAEGFSITVTRAAQPAQPTETGPMRKHAPSTKKGEITR